jgi:hypothetical protein
MAQRPGYRGARADEFVEAGPGTVVVGVYWIDDAGQRREPLLFQLVTMRDGQVTHIQDYRKRERALKAARTA